MKKFLTKIVVLFIVSGFIGCNQESNAKPGANKSYDLMGSKVSFVAPSEPWQEKVQTVGEESADLGLPANTALAVTFRRPQAEGIIAVGVLGQQKDKDGKFVELENDQETLNQIALWVEKRDGERLEQEYTKVLGHNAFRMVFEVGDPQHREKGEQIHFTRDGRHYSLSIIVPKDDFNQEVGQFRNLVTSFNIEGGQAPAGATPVPSASP